jgi:type VI secretion system secreted protein VgrG
MALQQATRLLQVKTPLGDNKLVLTSLSGAEYISDLFRFELELIGDDIQIRSEDVIGKDFGFSLEKKSGERDHYHGIVSEFAVSGTDRKGRSSFRATVVPWFWLLTQTTDCRIFQEKTVPEIVEQVFQDLGHSDFENRLQKSYETLEYCVQYRETDFDFVSRLLEREGIFYFFERSENKHLLVLADSASSYEKSEEFEVELPPDHSSIAIKDHLTEWEHRFAFHSGGASHTDYNFKTPKTSLRVETTSINTQKNNDSSKYQLYDVYPGEHLTSAEGVDRLSVRMEETEVCQDVVNAAGFCKTFRPAQTFKVTEHHTESEIGKTYVITRIEHTAHEPLAYETGADDAVGIYSNTFTCIPDSTVFRPKRKTPLPRVTGVQTAVVVGPAGDEIYTDEYGRVKVQFHWDREGKLDENSSRWVRASHAMAGRQWGFMAIPRIGQEVVVEFLEGNPDRPLIVGSVYNADQMPHYSLPEEKTKSYIKTNSTSGGDGYNELMFEDKKDDERLFLHAQKDMDTRVLNDSKTRVINNRHQIIGAEQDGNKTGDQCELVYQDKHLNVKRNQIEHIEGNLQLMVGNGDADDGGQIDVVSEKDWIQSVGGDLSETVEGAKKVKLKGGKSEQITGDLNCKTSAKTAFEAGQEVHIKAGMKVIIEAGVQMSLVGPGGFIDIGPAGVTIQGIMVKINSGGSAGSGSGCSPEAPAAAEQAAPQAPAMAWDSNTGQKSN